MTLLATKSSGIFQRFQVYLNGEVEFHSGEAEEVHWRRIAFMAFAFVEFLLGIPIWWITTTPYRAPLPFLDLEIINDLQRRLLTFRTNQTGVWENFELNSDYNLHFIFIHNQENNEDERKIAQRIKQKIYAFSNKYLKPIGLELSISSEHLWDFSLDDFLLNHGQLNLIDPDNQVPSALATELDRLSSPPIGQEIVLKNAVFLNSNPSQENKSNGLAIASWGGVFLHQGNDETALLNTLMASLYLQFSIPLPKNGKKLEQILERHKQRLAIENLMRTAQILNSLNNLASKIEDLVISDEVANYAAQSKEEFNKAYNQMVQNGKIDSIAAAQSCRLANRANGHDSLLELLNFPSDQKYGIYVPLFLPLLVPLLQPLALFILFLLKEWKKKKQNKDELAKKAE